MKTFISKFMSDESGATAIEYGLIAALMAVVIIAGIGAIGGQLGTKFQGIADTIQTGGAAPAA